MTSLFHGLIVCKTKLLYVQIAFAWLFFGGIGLMDGLALEVKAAQDALEAKVAQQVPETRSPDEFLPYRLGDQMTPHHRVLAYVRHVAETSDKVTIHPYGTTYEGRELVYLVVSDPANHARMEEIRRNNRVLTGLDAASVVDGKASISTGDTKPIVWLSYNIHGNEVSSSEAAMLTLYNLVDPANEQAAEWLKDVVVIIDPMLNPDGRDRYVNWFHQMAGERYNPEHIAREHHEPWPGGRPNHYYFDLNRDWAWQTQAESMLRADVYQAWMPHVHADFHEMGYDNPYFFAPAAEPMHEVVTPWQRELQKRMGENHAEVFDREGWLFFTKEWFDLLYPSYGDTWPTFQGAVGMTYEQAGHGFAGATVRLPDGRELTLKDRIAHHTAAGLSTVEVAATNAGRIVEEFAAYFERAQSEPQGRFKTYLIRRSNDEDALFDVMRFMEEQEIRYSVAERSQQVRGVVVGGAGKPSERVTVQEGDLLVSAYQPKSAMVQVFFEPETALSDSLTYDITAWSAFYRFGLEGAVLESRVEGSESLMAEDLRSFSVQARGDDVAFVSEWNSMHDARFLAGLLEAGVKVRFATEPFTVHGTAGQSTSSQTYGRGSLVITKENNRHLGDSLEQIVRNQARMFDRNVAGISSGLMKSGPDLGSSQMRLLEKPVIAVLVGEGTASTQAGEIWHFLDQQLRYPATLVHTSMADEIDLHEFTTLILPEGRYGNLQSGSFGEDLLAWVRDGGRLISFGAANRVLSQLEGIRIKPKENGGNGANGGYDGGSADDSDPRLMQYGDRERAGAANLTTGAVFRVAVDGSHPLGYGYGDMDGGAYYSLRNSSATFVYLDGGWNVGTVRGKGAGAGESMGAGEAGHAEATWGAVSGFVGSKALAQHEKSLAFGVQELGRGRIVYFADNPLFRGFWESGKLLVANAIFFVGND